MRTLEAGCYLTKFGYFGSQIYEILAKFLKFLPNFEIVAKFPIFTQILKFKQNKDGYYY